MLSVGLTDRISPYSYSIKPYISCIRDTEAVVILSTASEFSLLLSRFHFQSHVKLFLCFVPIIKGDIEFDKRL